MKRIFVAVSIGVSMLICFTARAEVNPALNAPDQVSWELFVKVMSPAATSGNNNVLFETWASDQDTFNANPTFPAASPSPKILVVPALVRFAPKGARIQPHALPGGSEETRRNKVAFDFIVGNNLFTRRGLKAAFEAKKAISFPIDAIEVKANWVDAGTVDASHYHVNTASDGKKYALVSMHVISKLVPNWTWATFEHQDNPGRCDVIGCKDNFGAVAQNVDPSSQPGKKYPPCQKSEALKKMMSDAGLELAFANYCLKGSQTDFVSATGIATLLGNSVTEDGFVNTSSCITCHSRASTDVNGDDPQGAGFLDPPVPSLCPTDSPCSPNGAPSPNWFWNSPGKPTQTIKTLQTDFVWAIPLFAAP
jgi:hypothetical protein